MSKWLLGRQQTNLDQIKIFLKVIGIENKNWIECVQDRARFLYFGGGGGICRLNCKYIRVDRYTDGKHEGRTLP
jgi:hypothetical protein